MYAGLPDTTLLTLANVTPPDEDPCVVAPSSVNLEERLDSGAAFAPAAKCAWRPDSMRAMSAL